jgi:hypothetical protein
VETLNSKFGPAIFEKVIGFNNANKNDVRFFKQIYNEYILKGDKGEFLLKLDVPATEAFLFSVSGQQII